MKTRGFDAHLLETAEEANANLWHHSSTKNEAKGRSLVVQRSCSDPLQGSEFSLLLLLGLRLLN